jgi:hypothetical protein
MLESGPEEGRLRPRAYHLLLLAALSCAAPALARAAAPRDAIRPLPAISSTSQFRTVDHSVNGAQTRAEETFQQQWIVDWTLPPQRLGSAAVGLDFEYRLTSLDVANYLSRNGSSDRGSDEISAKLRIDSGPLRLSHDFYRSDTLGRNVDSTEPTRGQYSSNQGTVAILTLPYAATLHASDNVRRTYSNALGGAQAGGEEQTTLLEFRYAPQAQRASRELKAATEKHRSFNYGSNTGNDRETTVLSARQRFEVPPIGSLQWDFVSRSKTEASLGGTPGHSSELTNSLSFQGDLSRGAQGKLPLDYSLEYFDYVLGNGDGSQVRRTNQRAALTLRPPVGGGRASTLTLEAGANETTQTASSSSSVLNGAVRWNFQLNPRFRSHVTYEASTTIDEQALALQTEQQVANANLNFTLPGKRGEVILTARQDTQRSPQFDRTSSSAELTNTLQLSPNARVRFLYALASELGERPPFDSFDSDATRASVAYSISRPGGLSLDTEWSQYVTSRDRARTREAGETYFVSLTYQPSWNWAYALTVNSTTLDTADLDLPEGSAFRAQDEVTAVVTFRF